jgi:hypothetical protein
MEETLSNSRFITFHRAQVNPQPDPQSTLTFAYGTSKYSKSSQPYPLHTIPNFSVPTIQTKS